MVWPCCCVYSVKTCSFKTNPQGSVMSKRAFKWGKRSSSLVVKTIPDGRTDLTLPLCVEHPKINKPQLVNPRIS